MVAFSIARTGVNSMTDNNDIWTQENAAQKWQEWFLSEYGNMQVSDTCTVASHAEQQKTGEDTYFRYHAATYGQGTIAPGVRVRMTGTQIDRVCQRCHMGIYTTLESVRV